MHKNILIATCVILCTGLLSAACNTPKQKSAEADIRQVEWLLGEWQAVMPDGILVELWEQKDEMSFSGRGFFIAGQDTFPAETMTLQQSGKTLQYLPVVKGQNDGKAVVFTLSSVTDNQVVFENPAHDFPQKITYTHISKDSLRAEISGKIKGETRTESVGMRKAR